MIPARFNWNDIGNWSSLADYLPLDLNNNASNSSVLSLSTRNNLVYSKNKKLIALCNVNDLILVETDDAILLLPKNDDQSIKKSMSSSEKIINDTFHLVIFSNSPGEISSWVLPIVKTFKKKPILLSLFC